MTAIDERCEPPRPPRHFHAAMKACDRKRVASWVRVFVRPLAGCAGLRQDSGSAVRMLRQSPGFSFAVVLMFGLGIGASTGFFCALNKVFWRAPDGVQAALLGTCGRHQVDRCSVHAWYLSYSGWRN